MTPPPAVTLGEVVAAIAAMDAADAALAAGLAAECDTAEQLRLDRECRRADLRATEAMLAYCRAQPAAPVADAVAAAWQKRIDPSVWPSKHPCEYVWRECTKSCYDDHFGVNAEYDAGIGLEVRALYTHPAPAAGGVDEALAEFLRGIYTRMNYSYENDRRILIMDLYYLFDFANKRGIALTAANAASEGEK